MKSYSEQRRERLTDVVFDYLSDENTTPDELLKDVLEEVKNSFEYYDKYAKKCMQVMEMIESNSITEGNDKDWNDFWSACEGGTKKWR
jgi:hypothetical protein